MKATKPLLLTLSLAACGPSMEKAPPTPSLVAAPPSPLAPYAVQVGDVLAVKRYYTPDLNEEVTVRPDGRITTTLAESVPAYGRAPDAIAADLRRLYAHELINPRLTVEVRSFAPQPVYVGGEVVTPGEYVTQGPGLTVVQALARAGGLRTTGDGSEVYVLRRGPNDTPRIFRVDVWAATSGEDPGADARLAPYDVVYVPRTGIARAYVWFNQHFQQFVPVNWGFSYNVNPVVNNQQTTHTGR